MLLNILFILIKPPKTFPFWLISFDMLFLGESIKLATQVQWNTQGNTFMNESLIWFFCLAPGGTWRIVLEICEIVITSLLMGIRWYKSEIHSKPKDGEFLSLCISFSETDSDSSGGSPQVCRVLLFAGHVGHMPVITMTLSGTLRVEIDIARIQRLWASDRVKLSL